MDKLHGHRLRQAAAQGRLHHRARQRQAQAGGVRGPELRLLQALRARPAEGRQRHHPHVPVPDPRPRLDREVAQTSGAPRTRRKHLAGLDGARPGGCPAGASSATPRRWPATSSSAASTRSPARPRWCSPTAAACPARSARPKSRSCWPTPSEPARNGGAGAPPALPGRGGRPPRPPVPRHAHDRAAAGGAARVAAGVDPGQLPGARVLQEPAAAGAPARTAAPVPVQQLDKCTWQVDCVPSSPLVLSYEVYAFDNSVRTAWLDAPARLLQRHQPVPAGARPGSRSRTQLELVARARPGWEAATGLAPLQASASAASALPGAGLRRTGRLPGGDGRLLERRVQGRRRAAPAGGRRRHASPSTAPAWWPTCRRSARPRSASGTTARSRRSRATSSCSTRWTTATAAWSTATPPR